MPIGCCIIYFVRIYNKKRYSRKVIKRALSPYKGTGKFIEYLRCPVCGKLVRGQQLNNVGNHKLELKRPIKSLGAKGFLWEAKEITKEQAERLLLWLGIAQLQVQKYIKNMEVFQWFNILKVKREMIQASPSQIAVNSQLVRTLIQEKLSSRLVKIAQ